MIDRNAESAEIAGFYVLIGSKIDIKTDDVTC